MSWEMHKIYFGDEVEKGTGKLNITEVGLEIFLSWWMATSSSQSEYTPQLITSSGTGKPFIPDLSSCCYIYKKLYESN